FGALEFHDVFKIYRSGPAETVALRGLELRIEPREFVAVFGPSGSGKSTMLHLAAGLDEPSAGDVRVFGRSLAQLDEAELAALRARQVAIVFQNGNLWAGLSAGENVALALRLAGRRRVDEPVERALDAFDLRRRERTRAGALSGGEQQRLAIAAAAARETTLLHVLGGLVEPAAGSVEWQGRPLTTLDAAARGALRAHGIAYVFQGGNLLPHFTAFENVAFAARVSAADADPALAPAALLEL